MIKHYISDFGLTVFVTAAESTESVSDTAIDLRQTGGIDEVNLVITHPKIEGGSLTATVLGASAEDGEYKEITELTLKSSVGNAGEARFRLPVDIPQYIKLKVTPETLTAAVEVKMQLLV